MSLVVVMLYILIAAFQPLLCSSTDQTVLQLERSISLQGPSNLSQLVERDRARHGRLLYSHDLHEEGVINYTLGGSSDLSVGKFATALQEYKLLFNYIQTYPIYAHSVPLVLHHDSSRNPSSSYYVQVDTGSDLTWIGCMPCTYCPPLTTSIPNISLNLYNPITTSTFSTISCYEDSCPTGIQVSPLNCAPDNDHCRFWIYYVDRSHVSGFYVRDMLTFNRNVGNSPSTVRSTTPFIFGCATVETGFLSSSWTDGILGLGHRGVSMISQLAGESLIPKIFAHCLSGDGEGGGILVLGEIEESDSIYSPLIQSQPHYNLDLQRISVNGQTLPIDPHNLSSSNEQGAFVDSGTTLGYLKIEALAQVNSAINASTSARPLPSLLSYPCYEVASSIAEEFPPVTLHFAGGADLILGPGDYLVYQGLVDDMQTWCMGLRPAYGGDPVILGDIVMKNRLFVYDLVGQRIGWKNYNCSVPLSIKHGRRNSAAGSSVGVRWCYGSRPFFFFYHHGYS